MLGGAESHLGHQEPGQSHHSCTLEGPQILGGLEIRTLGSSLTALHAYRQAALTRPIRQCVGTQDLF